MSKPAVIRAEFTDYRPVKTRKTVILSFEIPAEEQGAAFAALGYPVSGTSIWCAIARLAEGAGAPVPVSPEPVAAIEKPKPLRSNAAAVMCKQNKDFQNWLVDTYWTGKEEIGDYDGLLKRALGITSKTEIDADPDKGEAWERMLTTFKHRHTVRA